MRNNTQTGKHVLHSSNTQLIVNVASPPEEDADDNNGVPVEQYYSNDRINTAQVKANDYLSTSVVYIYYFTARNKQVFVIELDLY